MASGSYRLFLLLVLCGACVRAQAQAAEPAAQQPDSARIEQVPRVPGVATFFRGFNAGVTFSVVHDSYIGWYDVITPAISYTFSPHFSADASASIYPYRLTENEATVVRADDKLLVTHGDAGDTLIGLHGYFSPHAFQNTVTASLTAPTGNRNDGLSTGRVTFDFRDHIERYVNRTGFVLDLGVGDSSGLFNRLVQDQNSTLGPIAHFQTGLNFWLPGGQYIQSVAYEQLPIGDQKIYATIVRPGAPPMKVVTGRGVSEDNGFTTSVGIPLSEHITFSSYYNRSLRLHLDTVSVGITVVLRGSPIHKAMSLIDRAIREAEASNP